MAPAAEIAAEESRYPLNMLKKMFSKKMWAGGRVVSAANWHAGRPEFDPSQSQIFFVAGIKNLGQFIARPFELN